MSKKIPIKDLTIPQWRDICEQQKDPCTNCPMLFDTSYPRCVFRYILQVGIDDFEKFLELIHKEIEVA